MPTSEQHDRNKRIALIRRREAVRLDGLRKAAKRSERSKLAWMERREARARAMSLASIDPDADDYDDRHRDEVDDIPGAG